MHDDVRLVRESRVQQSVRYSRRWRLDGARGVIAKRDTSVCK